MFPITLTTMHQSFVALSNWYIPFRTILIAGVLACTCLAHSATASNRVILETVQDPELATILERSFTLPMLIDLKGQFYPDLVAELDAEVRKLTGILVSLGYLDARIEFTGNATIENPLRFLPVPGQPYRLSWLRVDGLPSEVQEKLKPALVMISSKIAGKTATQEVLRTIVRGVLFELGEASYGWATAASPEIRVAPNSLTAGAVVVVQPGPSLRLGEVHVSGSLQMDKTQAKLLVPFKAGEPYSETAINSLQTAFEKTNLFRRIRIEPAKELNSEGQIDLYVRLRDIAPDPNALAESSGIGPTRLVLTMLMIVLLECVRVTSLWSHASVRVAFSVAVVLMVSVSVFMVLERLYSFLK